MRRRYSSNSGDRRERAIVIGVLGLAVLAVLVVRLFTIQVVYGERAMTLSERNWLRPQRLPGKRGRILDRTGTVLADVVPSYTVVIDPQHAGFGSEPGLLDSTLNRLAALLDDEVADYHAEVRRRGGATYAPVRLHRNADLLAVSLVEESRSRLPGVSVVVDSRRYYPRDTLAVHVLGYVNEVNKDDLERDVSGSYQPGSQIGRGGVESACEAQLRGRDGVRFIEVNVRGRRSEAYIEADPIAPREGEDVILTLDAGLQRAAERALETAPYDGRGTPPEVQGAAVVLAVETGEILAMASRPAYDPNLFARRISHEDYAALNRPERPFLNRAIQGRYPPGSTFKGLTLYAALAEGRVTPTTLLAPCTGAYRYGNRIFKCWKAGGHGRVDAYGALSQSCDTYFYQIGPDLGVEGIAEYGRRFRLHERLGVDLPGEQPGLIPDRAWYDANLGERRWSRGVTLNLAIGQGEILLTPLALAQFAAVVGSGGTWVRPHVVLRAGAAPPPAAETERIPLDREHLGVVQEGMERAVRQGTARVVQFPEVAVAAKTGTAENAGYDHAVFIAYAPADAPEIALCVYLEHRGHGGAAAGPVARRILEHYFGLGDALPAPVLVEGD